MATSESIKAIDERKIASCPHCQSSSIVHRTQKGNWRCHDCKTVSTMPVYRESRKRTRWTGKWNAVEISHLHETYGKVKTAQIAHDLGRTHASVYMKASKEGLRIIAR